MPRKELEIAGMTCDDCAAHVKAALERVGAREVEIDWRRGRGTIAAEGPGERELNAALAGSRYRIVAVREVAAIGQHRYEGPRDYDLIVIGSGSAAFAAAIRARDLGRSVLLVERGTVGGTCVNVGCVPSKSLLTSSQRSGGDPRALAAAVSTKNGLVAMLRQKKYVDLLEEYGIELKAGSASLRDPHTVVVGDERLRAEAILIATGARPAEPPIEGLEAAGFLDSTAALDVTTPPSRLAVIGAGAVGLELGQMFGNFGSKVTFVEMVRVAPFEEPEVSEAVRSVLVEAGHTVLEGASAQRVRREGGEKVIEGSCAGRPFTVRADEILVATSRLPNSGGLRLEELGVETDRRGAIVVDALQRTSVPSIYAAGDVTNQPQFVYVAAAAGAAAAENALAGGERSLDFASLPRVTFTTPQIAAAGLTEAEAEDRGYAVKSATLPLEAVPRALVNGETRGLFKVVAEAESGRVLGVTVVAEAAGEVIQSAVLAIKAGMTVSELTSGWAPYLTMAEGLKLAAQTFSRDVSKLSCCAA